MDDFFSTVSKGIIILPIIIIVSSLIIKFNQNQPLPVKNSILTPTLKPSPLVSKKLNIDLNGPLVCHYKNNNQEYDLFVKNKKVSLEVKAGGQIVKYDLSSYVPLVGGMLNNNISTLESMASQYLGKKVDLEAIYKTCKKEDFK